MKKSKRIRGAFTRQATSFQSKLQSKLQEKFSAQRIPTKKELQLKKAQIEAREGYNGQVVRIDDQKLSQELRYGSHVVFNVENDLGSGIKLGT